MDTLGQPLWFGRYRLTSRIATGGMAEVYLGRHVAEDGTFGPLVALKRLLPHLVKDQQVVRMFLNEARITAQIHHPNVVGIVDLGHEDGEPYIAMELLDGKTFAELRERAAEMGKRVPTPITLRILCEACKGLDAAHNSVDDSGKPLKLVHRDFTPDNIHVGVNGEIKVIDFGVAKTQNWGAGTEPGTLKGKFFYMSPEMILARPVDHRADIFAAGVMLYEQLCGHRPFTGQSVEEVVMKIAAGRPSPPSTFDPAVPHPLEQVCLMALAHSPEARFQSLAALIHAIEAVGGEAQLATHEQVAEYVAALFPPEKDLKRQTLRRAREADPSVPRRNLDSPPLGTPPPTAAPPLGAFEELPGESPTKIDRPEAPSKAVTEVGPADSQAIEAAAKKPWQKRPVQLGAAAAVVVALAAAWVATRGPTLTPDEALRQAAQVKEPAVRARFTAIVQKSPQATAEQLKQAGALLLEVKAYDEALELAEAWEARSPKEEQAFLLEGRAAIGARKSKRAEAALDQARELNPGDPEPDVADGDLQLLLGDVPNALSLYSSALKKRPQDLDLKAKQGYLLSQQGRLEDAALVLQEVLAKRFDPASAAELGFVRFRQEHLKDALALLDRAVKKQPTLSVAHYYLGSVQYRQGDLKGAKASWLEADRLAPDDSRPLEALCQMQAQQSSSDLDETKKLISQRFPKVSMDILSRCTAPPSP